MKEDTNPMIEWDDDEEVFVEVGRAEDRILNRVAELEHEKIITKNRRKK